MANKINKEWHLKHRMPENPSLDERVKWHVAHARNCKCREIPAPMLKEIRKRNIKLVKP
jgi:hypothetical protein